MPSRSFLIRLAIQILSQVIAVLNKQINRLQQEVVDEMESWIFKQMDGFWRGEDAEMFKQEASKAIQEAVEAIGLTRRTVTGLETARDILLQADQRSAGLVSDLNREFSNIY